MIRTWGQQGMQRLEVGRMHTEDSERGALLVELLIALAVLAIVSVVAAGALNSTSRLETGNQARNRLSATAESFMERAKTETSWQTSAACTNSVVSASDAEGATGCDISSLVASDPAMHDEDFGDLQVSMSALGIDSPDDGTAGADADRNSLDRYRVRLSLSFADSSRVSAKLDPIVIETTIDPRDTRQVGSLKVQVCRIKGQVDERRAISSCNTESSAIMAPPAMWDGASGGDADEYQAYTCAHPDYFRDASSRSDIPSKCFSADPPFASGAPSYENNATVGGVVWRDRWPDYKPLASNLTVGGEANSAKFVSTTVKPVGGSVVQLKNMQGTVIRTQTTPGNSNGTVTFDDLEPGRYEIVATPPSALADDIVKSTTQSVPGESVMIERGVVGRATIVFRPKSKHDLGISIRTIDESYPWNDAWEDQRSVTVTDADEAPRKVAWNSHWGNQMGGDGALYRNRVGDLFRWEANADTGPGPWPIVYNYNKMWRSTNASGHSEPLCVQLRAVPSGRLGANFDNKKSCIGPPYSAWGVDHFSFKNLQPGLYTYNVMGIFGFVWEAEASPGFIWVDENGSTFPATGSWASQARVTYHGCVESKRFYARLFDAQLSTGCAAAVNNANDSGSGSGSA